VVDPPVKATSPPSEVNLDEPTKAAKPQKPKIISKFLKKKKIEKMPSRRVFLAPHDEGSARGMSGLLGSPSLPSLATLAHSSSSAVIYRRNTTVPDFFSQGNSSDTTNTQCSTAGPSFFVSPDDPQPFTPLATSLLGSSSPMLFHDELSNVTDENSFDTDHSTDERALSKQERSEIYARISNALHSTPLAGESAGTYDAYMKERSLFPQRFSGLAFGLPHSRQGKDLSTHSDYPGLSSYSGEGPPDPVDLRTWLSEDLMYEDPSTQSHPHSIGSLAGCVTNRPALIARYMNDGSSHSQRFF